MHILYLHQHFALPQGTTGTRSFEFARRWVNAGHRVTLICGITDQSGIDAEGRRRIEFETEGIRVIALNTRYSNNLGLGGRVWAFFKFMLLSFLVGRKVKDVDIIFATSTPLTIGIPAMLLKGCRRVPFVFEIRDQWPQIPIQMGYIRNPLLKKLLLWLERRIYKSAAAVVALSPGMADGVRSVLKQDKEIVIASNSSDVDKFRPDIDGSEVRSRMGWRDKFVVVHFGAMGKANGLDFLVEAADGLRDNPEILFVIIGTGSEKQRLRGEIERRGLKNIQILDTFPKQDLPNIIAACDVSTVVFADYPILQDNSANKFFDSLSAGKPILLNYSGWQREVIESNACGYGCRQWDQAQYLDKLRTMVADREALKPMGANARRVAMELFNRDILAARVLDLLERTAAGSTKASPQPVLDKLR